MDPDMTSKLNTRYDYAKSKGQKVYLTEDEYAQLKESITPLPNATVDMWDGIVIGVSEKLANRQEGNVQKV